MNLNQIFEKRSWCLLCAQWNKKKVADREATKAPHPSMKQILRAMAAGITFGHEVVRIHKGQKFAMDISTIAKTLGLSRSTIENRCKAVDPYREPKSTIQTILDVENKKLGNWPFLGDTRKNL